LRGSKAGAARGRRRHSDRTARAAAAPGRLDRRLADAAVVLVLAAIGLCSFFADPTGPYRWSYQALFLCLLVAAGARRALLAGQATAMQPGWAPSSALVIPAIACAAVLPFVHGLTIGFLSDDFWILGRVREAHSALDALALRPYALFFRPLSGLVWWAGARAWGAAPLGYHLVNVMLHAANSLLVYAIGGRLLGSRGAAALAGLLFAVHPVHVEPVLWAACQPDLLATAGSLLSLLLLEVALSSGSPWLRAGLVASSFLAFALALLAKESALALPGVVALRLALGPARVGRRTAVCLVGGYLVLAAGLLALRLAVIGTMGGYHVPLTLWNTAFPSALLTQLAVFLYPLNRDFLMGLGGRPLLAVAVAAMTAFSLWSVWNLVGVPARRLWFYLGYSLIMSAPIWTFATAVSGTLADTRLAYLPTVALAWLFGDVAAAGGGRRSRLGFQPAAALLAAGVLTVVYVLPWREAAGLADQVVTATARLTSTLPAGEHGIVLFIRDLPDNVDGAPVFRHGFSEALAERMRAPVEANYVAAKRGDEGVPSEVLALSSLLPGEYEVAWRYKDRRTEVLRAGQAAVSPEKGVP
jgi:hypothetical protein